MCSNPRHLAQYVSDAQRNARNVIRKRKQDLLRRINYSSLFAVVLLPLGALAYLIHGNLSFIPQNNRTLWFSVIYYNVTLLAFTAGYHKCYSHSTFRPKYTPLHVFFGIFGASVGVGPIRIWAAMHRAHHQYTDDPEKDPHSIKRGFFWAHCGWLLKKPKITVFYRDFVEHEFPSTNDQKPPLLDKPSVLTPPAEISFQFDESDSENAQDQHRTHRALGTLKWILWQERLCFWFFLLTTIIIPIVCSVILCEDSWINGLIYPGILRMFACQQLVFSTESICHFKRFYVTIPSQPFNDKNSLINCANPLISILTYGQSLQNYHHEFPHDYRASSLIWSFDPTKWFIFVLLQLGLVDDIAKAPQSLVTQLQIQQQQQVLNHLKSQLNWGTPISKLPMIATKDFRKLCNSASSQNRIYIVIQNIIHDITPFMDQHPGGLPLLKASHGKDATKAFYGGVYGHLTAAVNLLATMRIGVLDVGNDEDVWRRVAKEEGESDTSGSHQNSQYRSAEAA
ncbi:hypothetical protein METBIDRAFT_79371 [Metschnikowia bicuspidata var. bicuspidata NRRL YB-4993]|uniref:Acyl-CoA desaturase n=1 Tax=Metschnikowia bicuspidata var. bicuspidata NRRL YB-4993 TaxID=869754 RepID=A0A1A0H7J6_9ASCO|nr:hypothetical protein METBIDRAFT_79371 [Metschnikowia bicuspidata var. bicuspidata NRRL YB-4993]OBA20069.1 hypothetical protein METBIDRAFT_79371 [Metschnikowia bicuspidata var. bicuspidata NRRL YB-4993]